MSSIDECNDAIVMYMTFRLIKSGRPQSRGQMHTSLMLPMDLAYQSPTAPLLHSIHLRWAHLCAIIACQARRLLFPCREKENTIIFDKTKLDSYYFLPLDLLGHPNRRPKASGRTQQMQECICGGLRGSVVTYDLNLRPFLHHFRRFKSASLARAVIPTSAGAHTYVLTVVFGRASTWPAIDIHVDRHRHVATDNW
jgi:hypothetical protein